MDYRDTLNLPDTPFPMKAELNQREPELQARWQGQDLYARIQRNRAGRPKYILHDGPPYANGDVHLGTAFNKISKDIVVKYKTLAGFDAPYVPGWDCHGMPIEHKVIEGLARAEAADRLKVRQACRRYAAGFVDHQREQFKRLGVFADWEHPYLTMAPEYQAAIIRVFGQLAMKGFIYRGLKPVHWCLDCQSALAEAEVEYADQSSPSVTVHFGLHSGWPAALGARPSGPISLPIWTTTPWTLPANRAVAVKADVEYALVESQGEHLILAQARVEPTFQVLKRPARVLATVPGQALLGLQLKHPFLDRVVPVVMGAHVTLDAGTGAVHIAPGHGQEDYLVGQANQLEVFNPVDEQGRFTAAFSPMEGVQVFKANAGIVELLRTQGALLHHETITHSYPHCWRHHTPLIFRATEQWFMDVDHQGFRQELLRHIEQDVTWFPENARNRMAAMVADRPDWCLSRQRSWGVPLPVFYCTHCGTPLLSPEVFAAVEAAVLQHNADIWFTAQVQELLPAGTACAQCGQTRFRPETDILDVWFDSGVSHTAVLKARPQLQYPADLYLEGSDQHRGWFQVSLLTAVATTGQAPYRAVLTHGYTVDGDGRKMSKSLGNFITSTEAIQRYGGADILRLWVASENIQSDMRFSEEIFQRTVDAYRRIRNTLRFLLGNLQGFRPEQALPRTELHSLDAWMLHRLAATLRAITAAYEVYDFYRVYQAIQNLCAADLSAFYFDVLKDRLYADHATWASRRSAQTVLWHLLQALLRVLAPILVHTADEAWGASAAQGLNRAEDPASVHLADWPQPVADWDQPDLAADWEALLPVREAVLKRLEEARAQKTIRHSYEAAVVITAPGNLSDRLRAYAEYLPAFLVVSAVELHAAGNEGQTIEVTVSRAVGLKCERCWRVLTSVGATPEHPTLCDRCVRAVAEKGGSEHAPAR